jgi:hypothetical protein
MFTRKQYMTNECTHREYYGQFVDELVKDNVVCSIGLDAIRNSTDEHMNDIPLKQWDMIGITSTAGDKLRACGDSYSLAAAVCINKAAARQIKEELSNDS